jgi:hypothetical protein
MSRRKEEKAILRDAEDDFYLPYCETSSEEEDSGGEDEEKEAKESFHSPVLTQGTSDAVNNLRLIARGHGELDDNAGDDKEVIELCVRQCEPFVPHPMLVAQVKFENTLSPPTTRSPCPVAVAPVPQGPPTTTQQVIG